MGDITTSFVKQFKDNIVLIAQQMSERFRSAVRLESSVGEEAFHEQLGPVTFIKRTTRNGDSPIIKSDFRRRRVTFEDYEWGDLFDKEDKLNQLIDPQSAVVQAIGAGGARTIDKIVIDAMNGTAYTGKTGATSVVLPAGQKIVHGGTGLTKAKMIAANKLMDAAEVPKEDRFIAVSAEQLEDLLGVTEVTSSDYNTVKALVQGEIDTWLGFKFIHTEQLNVDATPSRLVLCWQKTGVLLDSKAEPKVEIDKVPLKGFATYVYAALGFGATRMEEVKVVEIACNE
jgi:hypothetical protein